MLYMCWMESFPRYLVEWWAQGGLRCRKSICYAMFCVKKQEEIWIYFCLYVHRESGRICEVGNWQMRERHRERFSAEYVSNHLGYDGYECITRLTIKRLAGESDPLSVTPSWYSRDIDELGNVLAVDWPRDGRLLLLFWNWRHLSRSRIPCWGWHTASPELAFAGRGGARQEGGRGREGEVRNTNAPPVGWLRCFSIRQQGEH